MKPVNENPRDHPLDEWLSFEQQSVQKFKEMHPDLWKIFGESINLVRAVPYAIGQHGGHTVVEMHRLMLWQKVLHYQTQSLFLLMQSQLDAGFALLRLAAELSRDIVRIADNEEMMNLWVDRENKSAEYKNKFRFDPNSPDEESVYQVYKFASKFGVHGHLTDSMFSEILGAIGESGSMLSLGVSNYGVLDAVHIWMMSFLPMHNICAKSFLAKYLAIRPEIFVTLRDYKVKMEIAIESVSVRLESLKR